MAARAAKPKNHGRPWTEAEKAFVSENRGKMRMAEIAAILGRGRDTCYMMCKYQPHPRRKTVYPAYAALGIPCPHPKFQKAGFTSSKQRNQMWRCVACKRTTIDPPNFPERKAKARPAPITKPCRLCGTPVTRTRGRRFADLNWFCCSQHQQKWSNDQAVIRRGKRGKRKNRLPNDMKRWTDEERRFLLTNAERMSYEQMGIALSRGKAAIQSMCLKLGVGTKAYWTKAEEQFLIDNQQRGWKWCAEQLGRSKFSVQQRGNAMGLQIKKRWSKAAVARIYELHAVGLANVDIAAELECASQVVRGYLIKRGLRSNKPSTKKMHERRRATMLARHGVADGGTLRGRQNRRLREAAFAIEARKLASQLAGSARREACPT